MKGVVFTEFLEMLEMRFSADLVDDLIAACDLPSGGAYTAVGTYDHLELVRLVTRLSEVTGAPPADLVRDFGRHLFGRFAILYPRFFTGITSAFQFLATIEPCIHAEVKKLYPDAELPHFDCKAMSSDRMDMVYRSSRPFADLAEGLIIGCFAHFDEAVTIERRSSGDGAVHFTLQRKIVSDRWATSSA
jgi:hypothetical protein